jgi:hypothetical protein
MFKFSKRSNLRRLGVDCRLIQVSNRALEITVIDFGIPKYGGKRTAEDQYDLFLDGKSRANGTNDLSYHQSGKALDFFAFVDGKASWHPGHLAMVASAFLQAAAELGYKLTWGGLWKPVKTTSGVPHGWDAGHVQLED